jgi:hypothetical protein
VKEISLTAENASHFGPLEKPFYRMTAIIDRLSRKLMLCRATIVAFSQNLIHRLKPGKVEEKRLRLSCLFVF